MAWTYAFDVTEAVYNYRAFAFATEPPFIQDLSCVCVSFLDKDKLHTNNQCWEVLLFINDKIKD